MGLGGFDIYFSNLDIYGFPAEAKNFGKPLNSRMDDFGFIYNSEKNLGYFSSNRNGYNGSKSDEVYQVKMLGSQSCGSMLTGIVRDKNTEKLLPGTKVELQDNFGNPPTLWVTRRLDPELLSHYSPDPLGEWFTPPPTPSPGPRPRRF